MTTSEVMMRGTAKGKAAICTVAIGSSVGEGGQE